MGDSFAEKLLPPPPFAEDGSTQSLPLEHQPLRYVPDAPGRPAALQFAPRGERTPFPTVPQLSDARNRGIVLHFFANHELLAIELMALALLRFPDAPASFRRGLAATVREEQDHLRLYEKRMTELGSKFGDVPVNRFFWDCLRDMRSPLDFITGMSLTFEQANLDFSIYYQKIFADIGDHETAAIMQKVYEDEIGHVKHGVTWLTRWKEPEQSLWDAYRKTLRLPLSPARAKGPIFDRDARRRADLTDEFMENLYVHAGTKGRVPSLYWYNADCELELSRESPGYNPQRGMQKIMSELMTSLIYVAKAGDVVLTHRVPSTGYLKQLKDLGFELPEFHLVPENQRGLPDDLVEQRWENFCPWGWTPRTLAVLKSMHCEKAATAPIDVSPAGFWKSPWMELFRKSALPQLRRELRSRYPDVGAELWGPEEADGALLHDLTDVLVAVDNIHSRYQIPAVIKSPYGFAGSGMLRAYPGQNLSDAQLGWIERQLDLYGCVLIEPWMKRVVDLSAVWSADSDAIHSFVFYTNAKGQYKGHCLQPVNFALLPEHRRYFFDAEKHRLTPYDALQEIAAFVREKLGASGYRYAAGIDTMLYEFQGKLHLKILGEVNCRMTMGHVARGLRKHVLPTQRSLWQSVSVLEAQERGWPTLRAMAQDLQAKHPPQMKQGMIEKGIFFTNDPSQCQYVVGLVAVGPDAIDACEGLGALGKSVD